MPIAILFVGFVLGAFLYSRASRLSTGPEDVERQNNSVETYETKSSRRELSSVTTARRARTTCVAPDWLWGAVGAFCALVSLSLNDNPLHALLGTLYLLTLGALFICDLNHYRLPDVLTATLLAVGGTLGVLHHGLIVTLVAAFVGAGLFWAVGAVYFRLRGRHGLGGGDVKMMAGLSAAAGPFGIAWIILLASGSSLFAEMVKAGGVKTLARAKPVPFGCGLAVAGAILWGVQAFAT